MKKSPLYHDGQHTQLRLPQGIPAPIPALPGPDATLEQCMQFSTDCVFHVSHQNGNQNAVYLTASSARDMDLFVRIVPSTDLVLNGSKARTTQWPSTSDAIRFRLRAHHANTIAIAQGLVIRSGAAIVVFATAPGSTLFGYFVDAGTG